MDARDYSAALPYPHNRKKGKPSSWCDLSHVLYRICLACSDIINLMIPIRTLTSQV